MGLRLYTVEFTLLLLFWLCPGMQSRSYFLALL